MIENLSLQYPLWFILFCFLLGALYAGFMYFKEDKFDEAHKMVKPIMALLRFLAISLISFFLLSPVFKQQKEELKQPIIIVAEDKSQSLQEVYSDEELASIRNDITNMVSEFEEGYEVVRLSVGPEVVPLAFDTFPYNSTNISNAIQYIYEGYVDQNIGAIILATDGIYNEGKNPLYENAKFGAPLYTIALGDTTVRKDLSIGNVLHNSIAYLNDKVTVQVDINANNSKGERSRLTLYKQSGNDWIKLDEKIVTFDNEYDYVTTEFVIETNTEGVNRYRTTISPINGEVSTSNNSRQFFIEVLDSRQKILVLADGPHPDVSAFNSIISTNKNYEVETGFAYQNDIDVSKYDMIIFHNLPSDEHDIQQYLNIMNKVNMPRMFVVGTSINQSKFNTAQDAIKLTGNSKANEVIQPDLNSVFSLFTISDELNAQLKKYPPLTNSFGDYREGSVSNTLLFQKIKKVATKYPLLSFSDQNGIKSAVLAGEGLWRWRIFDYQEKQNYDAVSELVNKTIQYITTKEDKRKFRVNLPKSVYKDSEDLQFDAQLYNSSYELVNTPDVLLEIRNDKNELYNYSFSKTNNYYTLNAGKFPEGNYRYKATVNVGGEQLSAEGKFSVERILLEQYSLTANHGLLSALSDKFNGQMFRAEQINQLKETVLKNENLKPVIYLNSTTQSLLDNKWIFFLLLFLLGLEWFMRRFNGSY